MIICHASITRMKIELIMQYKIWNGAISDITILTAIVLRKVLKNKAQKCFNTHWKDVLSQNTSQ